MGLCFGGAQIGLGLTAFALGFLMLSGLKRMELQRPQEHRGVLTVSFCETGSRRLEVESILRDAGLTVASRSMSYDAGQGGAKRNIGWKDKRRDVLRQQSSKNWGNIHKSSGWILRLRTRRCSPSPED